MVILKEYVMVKELKKDCIVDGLLEKYDDNSPYMFCKLIDGNKAILDNLSKYGNIEDLVLLIGRVSKIPYLGSYLVDSKDIIGVLTKDEYNNL